MDIRQILQVRRFNRLITQRVGALEDSYLSRGRPLAEARLLYEVGRDGADIRDLRDRLGLDSGYVSRLLRALEAQGLVELASPQADRRRRRVTATDLGRQELAAYDQLSDDLAGSILSPLTPEERSRLTSAMTEVERLIRLAGLTLAFEPPDSAEARACLDAYFAELAARFEAGFDPAAGGAEADDEMRPPGGGFLLARLDGRAVGCCGLKELDPTTGEIKRLWVAAEARGLGLARRLLHALEAEARTRGYRRLRLDTNRALTEARALYLGEGYAEIPRFNDNPYAHHWFEKRL